MSIRNLSMILCSLLFAVAAISAQKKENSRVINGHKFVDLGLPSGLLWAETNIGAETSADEGIYFAWGETEMKNKASYDRTTYKYEWLSEEYGEWWNKYSPTDEITTLKEEDDAASTGWGGPCRMPHPDEFAELCNPSYCTWEWTVMTNSSGNGISGYKVTSNQNGHSIFLPAAGYRIEEELEWTGETGCYWSGNVEESDGDLAYCLLFSDRGCSTDDPKDRCLGYSIRPVAKP